MLWIVISLGIITFWVMIFAKKKGLQIVCTVTWVVCLVSVFAIAYCDFSGNYYAVAETSQIRTYPVQMFVSDLSDEVVFKIDGNSTIKLSADNKTKIEIQSYTPTEVEVTDSEIVSVFTFLPHEVTTYKFY